MTDHSIKGKTVIIAGGAKSRCMILGNSFSRDRDGLAACTLRQLRPNLD